MRGLVQYNVFCEKLVLHLHYYLWLLIYMLLTYQTWNQMSSRSMKIGIFFPRKRSKKTNRWPLVFGVLRGGCHPLSMITSPNYPKNKRSATGCRCSFKQQEWNRCKHMAKWIQTQTLMIWGLYGIAMYSSYLLDAISSWQLLLFGSKIQVAGETEDSSDFSSYLFQSLIVFANFS